MTRSVFSVALFTLLSVPCFAGESSGGLPQAVIPANVSYACAAFQVVYNITNKTPHYVKYKSLPFSFVAKSGSLVAGIGASLSHAFT